MIDTSTDSIKINITPLILKELKEIKAKGFTHDSANNKTIEWFSPKHIFDSLDLVFDLDPCAPITYTTNCVGVLGGVPWIPAKKVLTINDDGLVQPWCEYYTIDPLKYGVSNFTDLNLCHQKAIFLIQDTQNQILKYIDLLNLALRNVPLAVKQSLCRMITLDYALRYNQDIPQNVETALLKERELNRLNVETTLKQSTWSLQLKNAIAIVIKAEKQSVLQVLSTITNEEIEILSYLLIGTYQDGNSVNNGGDALVPTVENQNHLPKITTSPLHTQNVQEQSQLTSSLLVNPATVKNTTNTLTNGVPTQQEKELNNISQNWFAPFEINYKLNTFLNPPYGRETKHWLSKMDQHRNGIALLFARTDCLWFHDYCAHATAINFIKGRLKFVDAMGVTAEGGAGAGSMLVAWGDLNAKAIQKVKGLTVYLPTTTNATNDI